MTIAFNNLWVTVHEFARAAAKTVFEKHNGQAANELGTASVFGPAAIDGLKESQSTLEDSLLRYAVLSCANDCLWAVWIPVENYINLGGNFGDLNLGTLMPVIKPVAAYYAAFIATYAQFSNCSKKSAWEFVFAHARDRSIFGLQSGDTRFSGLKYLAYAGILRKDKSTFAHFSEQAVLPLFDKSVAITGTVAESADSRAALVSVIDQLNGMYYQFTSAAHSLDAARPAPVPASTKAETKSTGTIALNEGRAEALQKAQDELSEMIGLPGVKENVRGLMNFLTIQKQRRRHGLRESTQSLH
jgi:hypothetical protein